MAGTGDRIGFGDEEIDRIDITSRLGTRASVLIFDYFKTLCFGAGFTVRIYVDGDRVTNQSWQDGEGCSGQYVWSLDQTGVL